MESIILRPTKTQAIQIISEQAPHLLEVFRDFQALNGGWLTWPHKFLEIKKNLKIDNYVTLYEDKRRIDISLALSIKGKQAFLAENEALKKLSLEEQQKYIVDFTQDLMTEDLCDINEVLPGLNPTKEQQEQIEAEFEALSETEKTEFVEQVQYLYLFLFSSLHNYFSIMVCGEALTTLVPKAIKGDDKSFCKAVKIDRNLIHAHPYFIERYKQAQAKGDSEFLRKLSNRQSTPGLIGKISYPGLYIVFAMLESIGWLDDLKHREILDICDLADLDRWQNRIEDVSYLSKRLKEYRSYQKTGGVSMHSN